MKRKINWKVVLLSLLAIGFLVLTFLVDWLFIIGAVVCMILNQRELMKKRN
ncbi:MAG: hypothetical protein P8X70_01340 [Nanoarchaeota archaeon]